MGRALWQKIASIVAIAMALLIPLKLIESKIEERKDTRSAVIRELANTSVGEQTVSGPVLVFPCIEHYYAESGEGKDGSSKEKKTRDCTRSYVADELSTNASIATENRYRGIYSARFFVASLKFQGRFDLGAEKSAPSDATREWSAPLLLVSVLDARGIRNAVTVSWDGTVYPFKPGLRPGSAGAGLHAVLAKSAAFPSGVHAFSFSIDVLGLQALNFVPSARQHDVSVAADWPHPSFAGRHLPLTRQISDERFEATWRTSELSSQAPRILASCGDPACRQLEGTVFGVNLIEPVDVYVQALRAVRYALLFVLLTFAAFFLFEVMRELPIHPVQYGLVGLALAMFFLLLIALSEHIPFVYAYLVSTSACVALIAFYLHAVLKSRLRALGFGGMLTALYTMLYALLRSEDHSLLLGAILVFAMLAAVMILTRRIDWYAVSGKPGVSV